MNTDERGLKTEIASAFICIANHKFLVPSRRIHQAAFGMSRLIVALDAAMTAVAI